MPAHGLEPMELLAQPAFGKDRPLEEPDLLLQDNASPPHWLSKHAFWSSSSARASISPFPGADSVALDRLRQVAGEQVMDAQDLCGALAHELGALAHQVTQGPQLRWADVPLRQDPQPQ